MIEILVILAYMKMKLIFKQKRVRVIRIEDKILMIKIGILIYLWKICISYYKINSIDSFNILIITLELLIILLLLYWIPIGLDLFWLMLISSCRSWNLPRGQAFRISVFRIGGSDGVVRKVCGCLAWPPPSHLSNPNTLQSISTPSPTFHPSPP